MARLVTGGSFGRNSSLVGASKEDGDTPTLPDPVMGEAGADRVVDVEGVLWVDGKAIKGGTLECKDRKAGKLWVGMLHNITETYR